VKTSAACRFLLVLLALPASLAAQPEPEPVPRAEPPSPSLRARFGIDAVRPWLRAEPTLLRQRAFERLGTLGSNAAIELLATALGNGGEARDARERLVVVRALAPHTHQEGAVVALVRALGSSSRGDEPKDALVERTAALALARSKNPRAARALFQALRQPGRVAAIARLALRAYPPRDLDALLTAPGVPTSELLELLGELANPRARSFLANLVHHGSPALRGPALGALARSDPAHAVALARVIVRSEPASDLGVLASWVLARANAPEVPQLIGELFRLPERRGDALGLALAAPTPAVGEVLSGVSESPADFEALAAALGRAGGRAAEARLERWLADPDRGWAAAYALAKSENGSEILERAAERDGSRRVALLGLALGAHERGNEPNIPRDALSRLMRSKLEADRGAAGFVLALLDPKRGIELVRGPDLAIVRAIARAGLDPEIARALAGRLVSEKDATLRASLAICLARPEAADLVPTDTLLELVETHGAAAPLAVYALAARDGKILRPLLSKLLASSDPGLRAHAALGLARSEEASSVGLLAATYRFEPDARVRRAVVRALSARREPGREPTLRLARDLDPDDRTRALARAALDSDKTSQPSSPASAWLRISPSLPASETPLVLVELSDGLLVPAAADADGSVTLVDLPVGAINVGFAVATPGTNP
jgi:HEAT repeat protein